MRGLDDWITGHYGEDQFKNDPPEIDDEGLTILGNAMDYLHRAGYEYSADDEDHAAAMDILSDCIAKIREDYSCRMCGQPTRKKNDYCSRNCAKADAEGL